VTIFWVKNFSNSLKIGYKKKVPYDNNFSPPLSFVAVYASEIRDPGWVKIRIRDPG
jgi:hypothetical protein